MYRLRAIEKICIAKCQPEWIRFKTRTAENLSVSTLLISVDVFFAVIVPMSQSELAIINTALDMKMLRSKGHTLF